MGRVLLVGGAALLGLLVLAGWLALRMDFAPEPELPGALERTTLAHEGRERSVLFYRPAQLAPSPAGKPLVRLLAVHGGGHTVPHPDFSMPRLLGRTSRDHAAANLVWEFFAEAAPAPAD